MSKAGLRVLGASAFALCAVITAASGVGSDKTAPPLPRYSQPASDRGSVRVAALFGESDEEKAAREQHEQNQDDSINALNGKIRDLEETIRNLTGDNETLGHRVDELESRLARQQKDFEYRLCAMAAQQLGAKAGQGDANAVPCTGESPASGAYGGAPPAAITPAPQAEAPSGDAATANGAGAPRRLAPGPGVLGTLPADSAGTSLPPAPSNASDAHASFAAAMNLLAKGSYAEASAGFRSFADTNPKDELAPQAVYWVGDIAYVQKDFANAARAFAEIIKKYPTSARAPDSMLKLGQSLIAAGQKKEGCTALAALPAKYPHAAPGVLAQGSDARKAVCRGIS